MCRSAVAALSLFVLASALSPARAQVVVNEIMADPASDWDGDSTYSYRGDEWVEVFNAGTEVADMSLYWLSDSDSTLLYRFSGELEPGAHGIVYGSDAVGWQRANGVSAVGLRLNNSGDTVMLWRLPREPQGPAGSAGGKASSPGMVLADSYSYLNHEAEDDRSTGRLPDGGSAWVLFDGLNRYSGTQEPRGEGCVPTPGGRNSCPAPAEDRSWGAVKALYR